jgi:hypothetical protein
LQRIGVDSYRDHKPAPIVALAVAGILLWLAVRFRPWHPSRNSCTLSRLLLAEGAGFIIETRIPAKQIKKGPFQW